jgi:hypothetical protein
LFQTTTNNGLRVVTPLQTKYTKRVVRVEIALATHVPLLIPTELLPLIIARRQRLVLMVCLPLHAHHYQALIVGWLKKPIQEIPPISQALVRIGKIIGLKFHVNVHRAVAPAYHHLTSERAPEQALEQALEQAPEQAQHQPQSQEI